MAVRMRLDARALSLLGMAGLLIGLSPGPASAAPATAGGTQTCTGTLASPGTLAGTYGNVVISGTCVADAGPADVTGNLTIAPGGALAAVFGLDDQTGTGNSNLTVHGNLTVGAGASLILGCDSKIITTWGDGDAGLVTHPSNPCFDDPNRNAPTLSTKDLIDGNLTATDPLGVVLHNVTVRGNVTERGGGAGLGCAPAGIFTKYQGFPEYSDYEETTIGGNFAVTGLATCWFGVHRDSVGGNVTDSDNTSGKDSMELDTSVVLGNQSCANDSPAIELGDGNGQPDQVGGNATGECGFNTILANPSPGLDVDVAPTYQPAAVHLHQ